MMKMTAWSGEKLEMDFTCSHLRRIDLSRLPGKAVCSKDRGGLGMGKQEGERMAVTALSLPVT